MARYSEERFNLIKDHLKLYKNTSIPFDPKPYLRQLKEEGLEVDITYYPANFNRYGSSYVLTLKSKNKKFNFNDIRGEN